MESEMGADAYRDLGTAKVPPPPLNPVFSLQHFLHPSIWDVYFD